MGSNDSSSTSISNPPRGTVAIVCIVAAVTAALLWTGLIYLIYRKRKQRQLKQHKRTHSLLDPSGSPRDMSALVIDSRPSEVGTEKGGLHQRSPSKMIMAMTPTTAVMPTPTTMIYGSQDFGQESPSDQRTFEQQNFADSRAFDGRSRRSSYSVPPPAIPDEPIELMDKHYSQQFGKFKAVEWEKGEGVQRTH